MPSPKVSVIVETYNHEKFIEQALEGVLKQKTNFPFEIIVLEDCSTDRTRDIIQAIQQRASDRIRAHFSPTNSRTHVNLANTLRGLNSEYVALLDGDDYWLSEQKLQKQADFLDQHPECAMCFHGVTVLSEPGHHAGYIENPAMTGKYWTIEDIVADNLVPSSASAMIRVSTIKDVPKWYDTCTFSDWELYIWSARQGSIGGIDEVLAVYRIHSGGMWAGLNKIQQLETMVGVYRDMNERLGFAYDSIIQDSLSKKYTHLAREYRKLGDWEKGTHYLNESINSRAQLMAADLSEPDGYERFVDAIRKKLLWAFTHPISASLVKGIRLISASKRQGSGIHAQPNPITVSNPSDAGKVEITWECKVPAAIHVGDSGGPVLTRIDSSKGRFVTRPWVSDGTQFYLRNSQNEVLDVLTVNVNSKPFARAWGRINSIVRRVPKRI